MREVEGAGLEAAPAGAHPAVSTSKHVLTPCSYKDVMACALIVRLPLGASE